VFHDSFVANIKDESVRQGKQLKYYHKTHLKCKIN